MADARRMRRERTSQQIEAAIERLRSNSCVHPKHIGLRVRVTKSSVAREAGVSIANLYRFPELCKQIDVLATAAPAVGNRSSEQRRAALVDALAEANRRIEALMTENTRLTLELGRHDQTLGLTAVIDLEERRRKWSHGRP